MSETKYTFVVNRDIDPGEGYSQDAGLSESIPIESHLQRSDRSRTMTEKGREHRVEALSKTFWTRHSELMLILSQTDALLIDNNNSHEFALQKSNIKSRLGSINELADQLKQLGSEENLDTALSEVNSSAVSMITRIVQVSLPSPRSTARSIRSAASSRVTSVRTSSSKQSSVSSQRIKVAAEAAALKAKLQAKLEENQNLDEIEHADRRLSQLKRKLAQQQLETQIKMEEAKLEVFEQEHQQNFCTTNCHSQSNLNVHDELQSQLGQDHVSHMTQSQVNQSHSSNESLIETLSLAIGASRLPVPEPPVFTGDPLLYPDWKASFSALIEGKSIPASDKIHYLKRYLGGPAREAVSGFFLLGSEKAYQQAKDILDQRFGNQFITSDAFTSKLNSWPKVQNKDKSALQQFSDFLVQCQAAQQEFPILRNLDDIREIQKIAQKLPDWASTRWNRIVAMKRKDKGRYPTFEEFSSFVKDEADIANDPALLSGSQNSQSVTNRQDKGESVNKRVFFTNGDLSQDCRFCKRKHHNLADCRSFARKNMEERREFVMKERLCFGCLNPGHMSKQCRNRSECSTCNKRHPTSLHNDTRQTEPKRLGNLQETANHPPREEGNHGSFRVLSGQKHGSLTSMIIPVFLSSKSNPQKEQLVYALVDTMSDSTFVTENVVNDLQAPCQPAKLRLTTLTNHSALITCKKFTDLQVRGFHSRTVVDLPESFTRDHIPVDETHIPTPETASCWPHLFGVKDMLTPKLDCPIGLLIGYNCPQALAPLQCITGEARQPFAIETCLGWSVIGGSPPQVEPFDAVGHSHRSVTKAVAYTGLVTHVYKTQVQEVTTSELLHLMERDFTDHDTQKMSQDDHSFLRILTEGIHQRSDGFYEMPLPFKQENPDLLNNRQGALHRALALQKQLIKRPTYKEHYMSFMEDLIESGEAEKIPQEEIHPSNSVWYIPHHGVYHPEKPNRVRVVFDCSARYHGTSLNDLLLQGPDLINPLVGVLSRFRKGSIAFTCDVQKMYHQFRVPKEQQDYLRFLWWEGGDLSKPPVDYRMKVHLFGATSSPGCANFGLKQIGRDYRYLSETAADFLDRNFYVDDGLRAEETVTQAKEVISNAREICAKANLRLHKITSNSEEVVKTIPESERACPTQTNVDIDNGSESMTLGLRWCTSDDTLRFKLRLKEKPQTRRGLLATVASVYDPLGLIAPVVLAGRQILQAMCKQNLGWDDHVPEDLRPLWERWIDDLQQLQNLQIPRCYHPASFGKPVKAQLHHFSDASTTGCGQCSYLRLENVTGDIHCALVMGKTRVVPLKPTTIPRLELQAATLSAKAATFLSSELDYPNLTHHFWTDSKVVLGYIKNESKRFHMFVANRVQQICQNSQPEQWNYVSTGENPADHASRGFTVNELKSSNWFSGPEFLWKREITPENVKLEIPTDDVEVKSATTHFSYQSPTSFEDRVSRFSSYNKLVRAVAAIVKCCARKKGKVLSELEARQRAEKNLIHAIQDEFFTQLDKQTNPLRDLDPFKDDEGLLRVGGRLKKSSEPHRVKHPVILPKKSHLSRLVALDLHERIAHQGRNMTINEIRSKGFWITGCRHVVSLLISKCVKCIKQRGKGKTQKMADLPEERVDASPPFTHCGLDCFGPFMIKEGRKELKRYGLLITCMASRAVHIEVLDDMSTDSFLNGLRCFIALRGRVRTIFCDQGTNFVGAKHELDKNLEQLNQKMISARMLDLQCEFKFNPPSSSHMGGVWERQIRTVRNVLAGILDQSSARLDTSSLRTLMYEIMAIVNSRPLTVDHLERADGPLPLTPNHILTMKSGLIMPPPPGHFVKEDLYLKKRWKRVQFLADQFWTRWRKEYLQSLQRRSMWQQREPNINVNDIVLLQDEGDCRTDWKIARVVETFPGKDGLIRTVKLLMSTSALDKLGKSVQKRTLLDRPIHKLVVLIKGEQVISD